MRVWTGTDEEWHEREGVHGTMGHLPRRAYDVAIVDGRAWNLTARKPLDDVLLVWHEKRGTRA